MPDKETLLEALRDQVRADLDALRDTQRAAQEGAVHEEAKPENDKDTRATEASYLARGLARRVEELRGVLAAFTALEPRAFDPDEDAIAIGALVHLERQDVEAGDDADTHLFLAPRGGGICVTLDGVEVRVVTPDSPIGRALVGVCCGDDVRFQTPRGVRELLVVDIS